MTMDDNTNLTQEISWGIGTHSNPVHNKTKVITDKSVVRINSSKQKGNCNHTCFTMLDLLSDNWVLRGPTSCFSNPLKLG